MRADAAPAEFERDGFAVLHGAADVSRLADAHARLVHDAGAQALRNRAGEIFAVRDVWGVLPDQPLEDAVTRCAARVAPGVSHAVVRSLFFDKPPRANWAVPWHRDVVIAVRGVDEASALGRVTRKRGVLHVTAPAELLARMITVRLHLDAAKERSGALRVIPGSHIYGGDARGSPILVAAEPGDAVVMRPLLQHSSSRSIEGGRRVFHFELAPVSARDAVRWQWFTPLPSP